MDFEITDNPDYGFLRVDLAPDEAFFAESGAMTYQAADMEVKARTLGGFFKAMVRKLVAKESLMVGRFSHPEGGRLGLSPMTPGSVLHRHLDGTTLHLTRGTFLGATDGIQLKTRFVGLRGFLSGEGPFFIEASGHGQLFFNSYGAVIEREVEGSLIVDTGHLVVWEDTLEYRLAGMGNLKSTLFSGEGLTLRFSGRGRVWLQSRTLRATASWLRPYLQR